MELHGRRRLSRLEAPFAPRYTASEPDLCRQCEPMAEPSPHLRAAQQLAAALRRHLGDDLVAVVLFGSVARGEERPDSDTDVLVVARGLPATIPDRRRHLCAASDPVEAELQRACPYACLSLLVRAPAEVERGNPVYWDMTLPGGCHVLVDAEGWFAERLDRLRARMSGYGSRKVTLPNGTQMWDLKPDFHPGDIVDLHLGP